mgnify:CR=1 FL=1
MLVVRVRVAGSVFLSVCFFYNNKHVRVYNGTTGELLVPTKALHSSTRDSSIDQRCTIIEFFTLDVEKKNNNQEECQKFMHVNSFVAVDGIYIKANKQVRRQVRSGGSSSREVHIETFSIIRGRELVRPAWQYK